MARSIYGNTGSRRAQWREIVHHLLLEHEDRGELPTSIRFLFYELVQRGEIPKQWTHRSSGDPSGELSACVMDLRKWGLIPWEWIVDETRTLAQYDGGTAGGDMREWLKECASEFELDLWQGAAPLVLVESRSLAGVLRPVVGDYRAAIASTNGQVGGFLRTDIVPMLERYGEILYLGDLDYAGGDIEANTRSVLEEEAGKLKWRRLAITEAQGQKSGVPPSVKVDRRFDPHRHYEAWETEALGQTEITRIVGAALKRRLPRSLDEIKEQEDEQIEAADTRLKRWRD